MIFFKRRACCDNIYFVCKKRYLGGRTLINARYTVTVSDLRSAIYYALVRRNRVFLRIAAIVGAVAIFYAVWSHFAAEEPNSLVYYIGAAYLICAIFVFASAERSVKRSIRSPEPLVGVENELSADSSYITIKIPDRSVDVRLSAAKMACVVELSAIFLLYVDAVHVFIVPKRALDEASIGELRGLFAARAPERFFSRWAKKR